MAKVSGHTHLWRRGATYYFRAKVPVDLLEHYAPRREIKFSLKTTDRKEAERLVRVESVKLDQQFATLRNNTSRLQTATSPAMTDALMEQIVAGWAAEILHEDEQDRIAGMDDQFFTEQGMEYEYSQHRFRDWLARGRLVHWEGLADEALAARNLRIAKTSPEYRRLLYAFAKGAVQLNRQLLARQRGEVVETPRPQMVVTSADQTPALSEVFQRWLVERKLPEKTRAEWTTIVLRFSKISGDMPVAQITRKHVVKFKDALVAEEKASKTITKQIAVIRTVLEWATSNDLIPANPARGIKVAAAKVEREKRLPYEAEDLKRIFSSPIYTRGERPRAGGGEAAYWLPLLALFTGARIEELAQALVEDVKNDEGVAVLDISDRGDGKRVKNVGSRRRVPLHKELLGCGFLEYVKQLRIDEQVRLFPGVQSDKFGKYSPGFVKWWGRYARDVIRITDKRKVFHSFRHTFKDACRACGIPEDIHDALTGHSGGGVGRAYGGQYPLRPLWEAIQKLRYEGLVLPAPAVEQAVAPLVAV